uniref:Pectin acetylesterase n=1 Tax=Pyramimonas obovata TaxID=1411642 RepID=A0A7S0MSG2_9CHLO|mmetsp:Transcript_11436/g.23905  ORF Transcript_11436/g.23905 Transcript_11436/m.23905 type:complete len:572 (+) Transcript_11436:248-1963(+)
MEPLEISPPGGEPPGILQQGTQKPTFANEKTALMPRAPTSRSDPLEAAIKPCRFVALSVVLLAIFAITGALMWGLFWLLFLVDGGTESSSDELPCYIKDPNITSATYTSRLLRVNLSMSRYPKAVCNDGSAGTYYIKRAIPNLGRDHIWNIHFQGGYWCTDASQCQRRRNATAYHWKKIYREESPLLEPQKTWYSTTSKLWARSLQIGGVFAPPRCSPLYGVNQIFVPFCSSDAWLGELDPSNQTFGMHFQGLTIWRAVLQEVLQRRGLQAAIDAFRGGRGKKPLLLVGGYSAGARATMIHVDRLRGELGESANVYALMDSGVWLDIPPEAEAKAKGKLSLKEETMRAIDFFNLRDKADLLDPKCLEDNPLEQWKCIFSQYRLAYVQTPYTIVSSQRDAFMDMKLFADGIRLMPDGETWEADAEEKRETHRVIAERYLSLAAELRRKKPGNVWFMHACLEHAASIDQRFLNWVTNKDFHTTMMTALEKGLDHFGYIEYDHNCSRPCHNRVVLDGSPLHSDLLFQDVCYPVGVACGSCDNFSHKEQGVSMHNLITQFIKKSESHSAPSNRST